MGGTGRSRRVRPVRRHPGGRRNSKERHFGRSDFGQRRIGAIRGNCVPPSSRQEGNRTADLTTLSVTYKILEGGFGGGSLRFSIGIDTNLDGTTDGNIFVYAGTAPNFDDEPGDWVDSGNLLETEELRVDTSQIGGTFYDTWDHALELTEEAAVTGVLVVVDAGYVFDDGVQAIAVSDVQIGHAKFKAKLVGKGNR